MEQDFQEYITFEVTTKDGTVVEMAVVDEFDFEKKHYIVGALIKDDEVVDEGRYIYEYEEDGDDFRAVKIRREFDYNRIAKAYMDME